jgi:hypothetical protein
MRQLIAIVALVATAACRNDRSTTEPYVASVAGSYSLRMLNGSLLPFTLVSHDTTVNIDTDVILLTNGGDWSEKVAYRRTVGTAATTRDSFALAGLWTRVGNRLTFRTPQGLLYVGVATDTSLNLSDGAFTYFFVR